MKRTVQLIALLSVLVASSDGGTWVLPGKGYHEATSDVTSGMIGWWKFDNDDNDSSGANNGTPTGSPTFTTGRVNQCRSFSGSNYVQMSSTEIIATDDWTVSMIIQTTGGAGTYRIAVVNGDTLGSAYSGFQIGMNNSDLGWVECFTTGDVSSEATGSGTLSASTWYHVAIVKNGTSLTGYINGTAGTTTTLPSSTMDYADNGDATRVGADSTGSTNWIGLVDEVRFYNRALSGSEITTLATLYGF